MSSNAAWLCCAESPRRGVPSVGSGEKRVEPWNPGFDSDAVSPAQFKQSPILQCVWSQAGGEVAGSGASLADPPGPRPPQEAA